MDTLKILLGSLLLGFLLVLSVTDVKTIGKKKIKINNKVDIDRQINKLNDREFEFWSGDLLKIMGYKNIKVTKGVGDGGKDVICWRNNEKYYCEVKHFNIKHKVGRPYLNKLVGSGIGDNVKNYIFITSSYFTEESKEYAKKVNMILIDRSDIYRILKK